MLTVIVIIFQKYFGHILMEYIEKYENLKNLGKLLINLSYSKTIFFQDVEIPCDEMDMSFYAEIPKKL